MSHPKHSKDDTLRLATRAFHRHGYSATTLVELLDATRMTRGTLYFHFRDKHALFMAAVQRHYLAFVRPYLDQLRQSTTPKADLLAMVDVALDNKDRCDQAFASLYVCAAIELAPHDADVRRMISEIFAESDDAIAEAITHAQMLGEISPERDPHALARALRAMIQGVLISVRSNSDNPGERELTTIIRDMLR